MTKSLQRRFLFVPAFTCLAVLCTPTFPGGAPRAQSAALPEAGGPMFGVHYGVPLKWSLAIGAPLPARYEGWTPFIAGEAGLGGWRASIGGVNMTTELGTGYVLRASVLRTTSKAWHAPPQSTYLGPEIQFMPLFAIGARVGGLVRVGGDGGQRGLLTADVCVMF
jgi:hypothetical protein